MRNRFRKALAVAGVSLSGGYLLAGPGTGCMSFASETLLVASDFCFIFDCQNGAFGGTVDPCAENPLLTDCPELLGP